MYRPLVPPHPVPPGTIAVLPEIDFKAMNGKELPAFREITSQAAKRTSAAFDDPTPARVAELEDVLLRGFSISESSRAIRTLRLSGYWSQP